MWHPSAEDDGSQEFKISTFNELFSTRKRSHDDQESNSSSTPQNNNGFKRRCPPWSEVAEGLAAGKFTRGPMNIKHDLYGRVEKIYDQGEPTFYHCLGCHSVLRYNTGGSYRRHFINCNPNGAYPNFEEPIEKQPTHWFNTPAPLFNPHLSELLENGGTIVEPINSIPPNYGFEQSLIEWIVCDLVPIDSLKSGRFSNFIHNFCEQSPQNSSQKFTFLNSQIQKLGEQIETQCEQISSYQLEQVVEQMNLNGFALNLTHENCEFLLTTYYFDKNSTQWHLSNTVIDFFKLTKEDKRVIESQIRSKLMSIGVNSDAINECLIITDDYSMELFGKENNIFCLHQFLNGVANQIINMNDQKKDLQLNELAIVEKFKERLDQFKHLLIVFERNCLLRKLIMENGVNNVPNWIQLLQKVSIFLKNMDVIESTLYNLQEQQKIDRDTILNFQQLKNEAQIMEDLKVVLEMIEKPLKYQQASNVPTLGRTIPIISRLTIDLTKMTKQSNENLKLLAKLALFQLQSKSQEIKIGVEGVAAFLDPNSRRVLKTAQEEMKTNLWDYEEIKQAVRVLADKIEPIHQDSHDSKPVTSNNEPEDEYFFGFQIKDSRGGIEQELSDYEAQPIRGHVQPQKFWAERIETFPKLSHLASRFLCAQPISEKFDQQYTIGGLAEFGKRSQISYDKIPQLLMARNSIINNEE